MHSAAISAFLVALCTSGASAHLAAFAKGMYCLNGNSSNVNLNSNDPVNPLFQLPLSQWWFHHVNGCDEKAPDEGDFLEIPAGKSFTVEIAANQGFTTLSFGGQYAGNGVSGNQQEYPDNLNIPTCITQPNIHTQNKSMIAGTAFSIAYTSDLSQARPENMVIFSVNTNSPWSRLTSFDVPAAMPACPDGGCICAWNWIPNGCGEPNMYHQAFRCQVTGATSTVPVGTPQPAQWCEGQPQNCVKGPKQGLYWGQTEGNNIQVEGLDNAGEPKSPGYNEKCGFSNGAQNDIFGTSANASGVTPQVPAGSASSLAPPSASSISGSSGSSAPVNASTPPPSSPSSPSAASSTSLTSSSSPGQSTLSSAPQRRSQRTRHWSLSRKD